jgi:ribosome-associated protein
MRLQPDAILNACTFKTSRSSGKGGQNVNKVETKAELIFPVEESGLFNEEDSLKILAFAGTKVDSSGAIHITSEESRSQLQNKELCGKKLITLLKQALKPKKKRKPTAPTKASREKRLQSKKQRSEIKSNRKKLL